MKMAIVGPDGSGKDTQIELMISWLKREFPYVRVQKNSIWDSLQLFSGVADERTLHDVLQTFLLKFEPQARSLFLASLLKNSFSQEGSHGITVFNGYYYKYAATELAYGVSPALWEELGHQFERPELLIYLDVSVPACLKRRTHWSAYEQGRARTHLSFSFEEFQSRAHARLKEKMHSLAAHFVSAEAQPLEVFEVVKIHIQDHIRRGLKPIEVAL